VGIAGKRRASQGQTFLSGRTPRIRRPQAPLCPCMVTMDDEAMSMGIFFRDVLSFVPKITCLDILESTSRGRNSSSLLHSFISSIRAPHQVAEKFHWYHK